MKAPPPGFALFHVDTGVPRAGNNGSASVIGRDENVSYLGSSSLVIHGTNDVATLEAIVCREALSLAEDLLLHNIVVVSDSRQVVNDIQKGSSGIYGQVIEEIKLSALNFNCIFCFENRSTNFEADLLAKHSHSLDRGATCGWANPMIEADLYPLLE